MSDPESVYALAGERLQDAPGEQIDIRVGCPSKGPQVSEWQDAIDIEDLKDTRIKLRLSNVIITTTLRCMGKKSQTADTRSVKVAPNPIRICGGTS